MALQAALLPSTLSVPKKGNLAAVVKDTAFLGVPRKVSSCGIARLHNARSSMD
jgi:hypothetical protein